MKHSIFSSILIMVFVVFASFLFSNSVLAALPTKMIDYAWAPNFGWINFGNRVTIDSAGNFTGYGWSPNLGWIRMGSDLTGPLAAPDPGSVKANNTTSGANITGWMRACSVFKSGCSGVTKDPSSTEMGGWDGWFKMKSVTYDSLAGKFSGFSWGDLVGGWVNFGAGNTPTAFSVSCDGFPTPVSLNQNVTWKANVVGGDSLLPYSYSWYETKDIDNFGSAILADSGKQEVTKPYGTSGTYYRKVVVSDSSVPSKTVEAVCMASANSSGCTQNCHTCNPAIEQCGIIVTPTSCSVKVTYIPSAGSGVVNTVKDNKIPAALFTNNQVRTYDCGSDVILTANKSIAWSVVGQTESTCLAGTTNCSLEDINGQIEVTANFGEGPGILIIDGGYGSGSLVRLNNTLPKLNYPLSSSVANIRMSEGVSNITAIDWGGLKQAAASANNCSGSNAPQICIDDGVSKKCVSVSTEILSDFPSITPNNQSIEFNFPSKCPNKTNGVSVFHKTANWIVKLTANNKSTNLILNFNDSNGTNQ